MMMMAGAQGSVKQRGRKKAKDKTTSDWAFDREWCLTGGCLCQGPVCFLLAVLIQSLVSS